VITYCSNIHPGESWVETFSLLRLHLPAVKEAVAPDRLFPVGLRLSNRAANEMGETESKRFADWCREQGCFVPTINGFPFGSFHSAPVKENVYLPDWRHWERVAYTMKLANLLDGWMPAGVRGSISTVPVGFKAHNKGDEQGMVRRNLLATLEHLDRLRQKSGKEIILSLEPEPGCVLETTGDTVAFIEQLRMPAELRSLLGICYDCCHQAVEFEDPAETSALLAAADVTIGKVQVSSALSLRDPDRSILEKFCEQCYLHQVVIRNTRGVLRRYDDIPKALALHTGEAGEEWRIHFHVPVFLESMHWCATTRFFIEETLPLLETDVLLEIETYTWEVLPPELRVETVTESIVREIKWLKAQKNEAYHRS
jgi:hypothetical protein